MVWQRIRVVSWASLVFRFTLVASLKSVGARGLPPGGGVRIGPLSRFFLIGNLLYRDGCLPGTDMIGPEHP